METDWSLGISNIKIELDASEILSRPVEREDPKDYTGRGNISESVHQTWHSPVSTPHNS